MNGQKYTSILLMSIMFMACKHEDVRILDMETQIFAQQVHQEQLFQQALHIEVLKLGTDSLQSWSLKRNAYSTIYVTELDRQVDNHEWVGGAVLDVPHAEALQNLPLNAVARRQKLVSLIVQSDQQLLGAHVKATGTTGLENDQLRAWAEHKKTSLIGNLRESQAK